MDEHDKASIVRVDAELAGLARAYLVNRLKDADAIAGAIRARDYECIHRIGHNMRGSAEMFGFTDLAALGSELEVAADAADLSDLQRLHGCMARVLADTRIETVNVDHEGDTANTEIPAGSRAARDPGRVLVVDDDEMSRILITRYLEKAGYSVRQAACGEEALAAVREDPPPALVVLDVVMPGTSGLEVCRRIKRAPETASIPVVLLTGLERADERSEAMEAGADDFLRKPVSRRHLIERLSALAPGAAQY
jgi:CheY-like chemotaxis protein